MYALSKKLQTMVEGGIEMDFAIREAIAQNVKGDSPKEFRDTVEDAIARGDEHLLPGLGVFLEKWWQNSSDSERDNFTQKLSKAFQN